MDNSSVHTQNNEQDGEESSPALWKGGESSSGNDQNCAESKAKRLVRRLNSQEILVFKDKQLRRSRSCTKESFVRNTCALDGWVSKHIVTVDEKYLRRCLDFIHESASRAAPHNISLNLGWENVSSLSGRLYSGLFRRDHVHDLSPFDYDYPLASGTGNVVVGTAGQWIVGSIMGSKSMKSILKSPILHQFGELDGNGNFKKPSFNEVEEPACNTHTNSPESFISYSSCKIDEEPPNLGRYKNGSQAAVEHNASISSTDSTSSVQSSSCLSGAGARGMLQCIWKGGDPHFVFSLDDEKVVYMANLEKDGSKDNMGLDYVYLFHSRAADHNSEFHHVGKMMVSTSFTFSDVQSRIMEREFVLFGGSEYLVGEVHTPNLDARRNKGLSKKVMEVFRSNPSIKRRTLSRFGGSNAFLDNYSLEPSHGMESNNEVLVETKASDSYLSPNLQLAAVVVKDHLSDNHQEKVGGWGLKFLKKAGMTRKIDHSESTPIHSNRHTGNCLTSLDVLVPAGIHGGPRTRNGGPSCLTERWRSGGCCDCGGWDLGCPLTILKSRSSDKELSSHTSMQRECSLIELFMQGSKQTAPSLRMVNVHDGLYFVHFQSKLSALQSFSIVVAIIHAQTATLRPKIVQALN